MAVGAKSVVGLRGEGQGELLEYASHRCVSHGVRREFVGHIDKCQIGKRSLRKQVAVKPVGLAASPAHGHAVSCMAKAFFRHAYHEFHSRFILMSAHGVKAPYGAPWPCHGRAAWL